MNNDISRKIAHKLLDKGALRFNFKEPFTWTSGIKSPVYCDNRLSLSYVEVRNLIRDAFVEIINTKYSDVEVIAGVATGAIAQGAWVADKLNKPFIYVREKPKGHGLNKVIEGHLEKGQKVVIIEDHISTGGSSYNAFLELRKVEANVLCMIATTSYNFPEAKKKFEDNNCELRILSDFTTIVDVALEKGDISKEQIIELYKWHNNPKDYNFDKLSLQPI